MAVWLTSSGVPRSIQGRGRYVGDLHFYRDPKALQIRNAVREARRASAPSACWQSLHGPGHRSSATQLSSAIMSALPAAAAATLAPDYLAAHLVRGARARAFARVAAPSTIVAVLHAGLHVGGTHWYVVSAAAVRASACHARDGTRTHRAGSRGRASVAAMARQPCCSVLGEPVGRPGGEPDGGRDQHDGLARWWAGVATDRPPRARGLSNFRIVCPVEM